MRYSQFCDVDCDVTLLRIGQNDRFSAGARQFAGKLSKGANAGEAPQFQELRRHSGPSPLTASHTTRPIHTQEVTGSSPVAPTIFFHQFPDLDEKGGVHRASLTPKSSYKTRLDLEPALAT